MIPDQRLELEAQMSGDSSGLAEIAFGRVENGLPEVAMKTLLRMIADPSEPRLVILGCRLETRFRLTMPRS
jgi:hypothetical protein